MIFVLYGLDYFIDNQMNQYNRQPGNKIYALTERGFQQAKRNDSHQIWTLLAWTEQTEANSIQQDQNIQDINNKQQQSVQQSPREDKDIQQGFKLSKNDGKVNESMENTTKTGPNASRQNRWVDSQKPQQGKGIQVPKVESELDRLKKKSIQKYIKDQIPYTRTLSNSAFRKFYQRPCPENYGRENIKSGGVCYGDFMKTHNIQPHTLDSKPQTYQTYTSALNHGKRIKLDLEDRWKRIQRQLAKNLDYRELAKMKAVGQIDTSAENRQQILKENIGRYGQKNGTAYTVDPLVKTSKSVDKMTTKATFNNNPNFQDTQQPKKRSKSSEKPHYFIYKYKQGDDSYNCTRYARDRHGITCYVDNCFRENDGALLEFEKRIKPINAEKCKPQDVNIDRIRIKNSEDHKNLSYPRHYLVPNVEVPYEAGRYSRKKRASVCQTTA